MRNIKNIKLYDARTFTVRWRNSETPIEADQVVGLSDVESSDFYFITLKFITV